MHKRSAKNAKDLILGEYKTSRQNPGHTGHRHGSRHFIDNQNENIRKQFYLCFSVYLTIMGDSSYMKKTPGRVWSPPSAAFFWCFVTEYWFVDKTYNELMCSVSKVHSANTVNGCPCHMVSSVYTGTHTHAQRLSRLVASLSAPPRQLDMWPHHATTPREGARVCAITRTAAPTWQPRMYMSTYLLV